MQVNITSELRTAVKKRISEMAGAALQTSPLPFDMADHLRARIPVESFVARSWGEYLPLKDMMPREWMTACSQIRVRIFHTWDNANSPMHGVTRTLESSLTYTALPNNPILLPPKCNSYTHDLNLTTSDPIFEFMKDEIAAYIAAYEARVVIRQHWLDVANDVTNFLNTYPSLNRAVREWEGIKRFIPVQYIERMEQKRATRTHTAPKAAVKHDIDMEKLEAASVIGTLLVK